jgi:hypothetical protein
MNTEEGKGEYMENHRMTSLRDPIKSSGDFTME